MMLGQIPAGQFLDRVGTRIGLATIFVGWRLRPSRSPYPDLPARAPRTRATALSMTMPFVSNNLAAVVLMGLALFGNQWYAATYIGTVGDIVPQHLAGRVNGIAGFGDNGGWPACSSSCGE
jgi:MFS family permease